MPPLLKRRLRCFYCNGVATNDQSGIPRTWVCPHCEAVNHLDQRGQITDPPAAMDPEPQPRPRVAFAPARSPVPAMVAPPPAQSPFCDSCMRNQAIVNNAMAEYIPDEDDPNYKHAVATADQYREELENRYPLVCENCIGRVRDQVRAAGYAARTDYLRRILESSQKRKLTFHTPRQVWTLRAIGLAKWVYTFSVLTGTLWHILGVLSVYPADCVGSCLLRDQGIDWICFNSASMLAPVKGAIVADLLSLWWNPKWKEITVRPGGRMRRARTVGFVRLLTFGIRTSIFWYMRNVPEDDELLQSFQTWHGTMAISLFISAIITWSTVSIQYPSASFMQPLDPYLPNVTSPQENKTPRRVQPTRINTDVFDSMADSFTSSFGGPQQHRTPSPSPTDDDMRPSTAKTYSTSAWSPVSTVADGMDWTPTGNRFAQQEPEIIPPIYNKPPQPPARAPPFSHSIFAKEDPNPFHKRVPAFPKHPYQQKGPWDDQVPLKVPKVVKKTFVDDPMDVEKMAPRTRLRDAKLFAEPKLKHDHGLRSATIGLEESFDRNVHLQE